MIENNYHKITM